jgi:methylenetetrahydrofolate dehydrogenase (NADP+)/methenyltetrahydrofolate cyclohydrolase
MAAKTIDGKKIADELLAEAAKEVAKLPSKPCLSIVLVGDDLASLVYTKKKHDACARVGMESRNIKLPASTKQSEIIAQVQTLNNDPSVDAILVQLPLPKGIDEDAVLSSVALEKDVDGFHAQNFGRLALGLPGIAPCTPKGVIYLLKKSGAHISGKHAVVIGRSRIVGKPLSYLLLNEGATVTVCHSKTHDLGAITRTADIICSAVGKPRLVKADMIKEGAIVIDIGTSKENEKLTGDVDFAPVSQKAALITPVPGGVGPMTIAMLIVNTLECVKARKRL